MHNLLFAKLYTFIYINEENNTSMLIGGIEEPLISWPGSLQVFSLKRSSFKETRKS